MSKTLCQPAAMRLFQLQHAEILEAFGQTVRVLVPAALTGGAFCVALIEIPPHDGPPPHIHHGEDEVFLIQTGRFEFWVDGDCVEVGAGDVVYGARDVPHTFRNISDETATLHVFSIRAGFESFFRQCARVWGDGDAMPQILEIARAHQLEFIDPAQTPKVGAPANGKTPRVVGVGAGEAFFTLDSTGQILISARDTAGDFTLASIQVAPLCGPQLHRHQCEDEIVLVQSGAFEFRSSYGQRLHAHAGDAVWLPSEVPHSFRCLSSPAGHLRALFVPGGFDGHLRENMALLNSSGSNKAAFDQLNARYGLQILP